MRKISIGICVYNEEKNIGRLLDSILQQSFENCIISEIIVVSSGSTDNTNIIVEEFSKKDGRIRLLRQKERKGKASAVNYFLKEVKEEIVVVSSGDVIFEKNCLENLVRPFDDTEVGMTSVNPIPTNAPGNFMSYVSCMEWKLHNKFKRHGETIAFRKSLVKELPYDTSVDEAWIESLVAERGYKIIHVDNAIVYNKGPGTVSDFLKQRRRHCAGHYDLMKRRNYKVSSWTLTQTLRIILKEGLANLARLHLFLGYLILELLARLLGLWDYYLKRNSYIWEIAQTTKEVAIEQT
jgi:cellulose synthase/poly-beta-1,6-N-acetylglucosamine synthase-like glycosyltransferase